VANQFLRTPPSKYIKFIQVSRGFDVADNEIVNRLKAEDLVITGDIPLAVHIYNQSCISTALGGGLGKWLCRLPC
jgi:uncharacterized protein YaiI (UPF0178 family)